MIRKSDFIASTPIAQVSSRVKSLTISPDGNTLAGGNEEGHVVLWDLNNNNEERQLYRSEKVPVSAISFSNDGKLLVFGDETGVLTIWDLDAKRVLKKLPGHESDITDLEFNADNSLLASTSRDGTARLWIMENLNDLPIELDDHGKGIESEGWVWSVSFSPDGESLVTGAGDSNIRIWPVKPEGMANEICNYISENMMNSTWVAYVADNIDYQYTCEGKPMREEQSVE